MFKGWFRKISAKVSHIMGTPVAFFLAVMLVVFWAISGPLFGFSDTWQLVINTFTTVMTFLMVFLIQNTQNRESRAVHLKLDELIHSSKARDSLLNIEEMDDEVLEKFHQEFKQKYDRYTAVLEQRRGKNKTS